MINQAKTRSPKRSLAGNDVQSIEFFNSIGQKQKSGNASTMSAVQLIADELLARVARDLGSKSVKHAIQPIARLWVSSIRLSSAG
jgi:hypothetical protein